MKINRKWRVQSAKDKGAICIPYYDARDVIKALDEKLGQWTSEYKETAGLLICRVTDLKTGVFHEDVGTAGGSIEPEKSAVSDGLKRCAVRFGIGIEELYEVEPLTLPVKAYKGKYYPVNKSGYSISGSKLNAECERLLKEKSK